MTAITAVTAQNTREVAAVYPLAPEAIVAQVRAVVEDIGVDAVKIGMLGDAATIEAVSEALDLVGDVPVVLDPVMVSESGGVLLAEGARDALRRWVVPRAAVVTPTTPRRGSWPGWRRAPTSPPRSWPAASTHSGPERW